MSIILHLDMNSYFASVEQQANPHLRGRPVGVCEHLGGIIIAPSVEAKRLGIKLGTTVWDARKIYPKIVLLPVDPDKYRHITAGFLKILMDYSDEVEKASIDEAFADITACVGNNSPRPPLNLRGGEEELSSLIWDNALMLGLEIKQRIRQEVGEWVSCSIGIGPNKLLAKIAADLGEGDINRICVIRPEEIPALYECLKLTDIPGIGNRLERALNCLGIFTLKQLAEYPLGNLINQFGVLGYELHSMAMFHNPPQSPLILRGEKEKEIPPLKVRGGEEGLLIDEPIKSIGHSYTLPKPISTLIDIKRLMYKLAEKIGRRMRRQGASGSIIHYFHGTTPSQSPPIPLRGTGGDTSAEFLPLRKEGGEVRGGNFHKQRKIGELINDGREIYQAAWGIFQCSFSPFPRKGGGQEGVRHGILFTPSQSPPIPLRGTGGEKKMLKIMGISISGLVFVKPPEPLFEQYKRPGWLVQAMDKINDKYGEFTIRRGRLLGIPQEWAQDTVGFGRGISGLIWLIFSITTDSSFKD